MQMQSFQWPHDALECIVDTIRSHIQSISASTEEKAACEGELDVKRKRRETSYNERIADDDQLKMVMKHERHYTFWHNVVEGVDNRIFGGLSLSERDGRVSKLVHDMAPSIVTFLFQSVRVPGYIAQSNDVNDSGVEAGAAPAVRLVAGDPAQQQFLLSLYDGYAHRPSTLPPHKLSSSHPVLKDDVVQRSRVLLHSTLRLMCSIRLGRREQVQRQWEGLQFLQEDLQLRVTSMATLEDASSSASCSRDSSSPGSLVRDGNEAPSTHDELAVREVLELCAFSACIERQACGGSMEHNKAAVSLREEVNLLSRVAQFHFPQQLNGTRISCLAFDVASSSTAAVGGAQQSGLKRKRGFDERLVARVYPVVDQAATELLPLCVEQS